MKLKNIFTYFTDTIFRRGEHAYRSRSALWGARFYKVLYRTVAGLIRHDTMVRSAALTFYTLISIVPILALVFAVVKALGLAGGLVEQLYDVLPQHPETIDYVVEFAQKALENTRGGVIAAFGIVTLLWAVIRVFGSVEQAFNNIWEVDRNRHLVRQWATYIVVVVIVPVLWLLASATGGYALQILGLEKTFIGDVLTKISSLIVIWGMFTLLYVVVPNTKVLWRNALVAGIVAGTFFAAFQWGYIHLQSWMTSYNAIYGSFAALPLLLLWLQVSWEILLLGGELSFACQTNKPKILER